jgi:hypothetical protein
LAIYLRKRKSTRLASDQEAGFAAAEVAHGNCSSVMVGQGDAQPQNIHEKTTPNPYPHGLQAL